MMKKEPLEVVSDKTSVKSASVKEPSEKTVTYALSSNKFGGLESIVETQQPKEVDENNESKTNIDTSSNYSSSQQSPTTIDQEERTSQVPSP